MANYDAINQSAVITGTTSADKVDLNPTDMEKKWLRVLNVDGAGIISFRVDGTTAVASAAENYCIPAVAGAFREIPVTGLKTEGGKVSVSVICSTTVKYHVSIIVAPLGR